MKATRWEFRHRWWVIFFIFVIAFQTYTIDPRNSAVAIADRLSVLMRTKADFALYRATFALGALLILLSAGLRTWGTSYLQAEVMRDAKVHTERLLADGPYRYVRNPLYLGNILLSAGMGLMASRIGFVVLFGGMTVFVVRLILREEEELLKDRGESYRKYCAAVPRLLPALKPRIASAGNSAHWAQAIRAELMYWLLAVGMFMYAFTLRPPIFWTAFTAAIFLSWVFKRPRSTNDIPQPEQNL